MSPTLSTLPELIDIDSATETAVTMLDPSWLEQSVEIIAREHFNPTVVHDADLEVFARAERLLDERTAVFLDIGANVANTISSLIALGCRFTVHAFEINPALHAHLTHASAMYPGPCVIHAYGLDSKATTRWLYVPLLRDLFIIGESSLSLAHLQQETTTTRLRSYLPGETLRVGRMQVETRTLDSVRLCPSFMKIDVEGAEEAVLAGATETLLRCRPLIMVENSYPRQVEALLARFGYAPYDFDATRGTLYPRNGTALNSFYIDETWLARLRRGGLLDA